MSIYIRRRSRSRSRSRSRMMDDYEMQVIGKFLSYASRGDRIGLNLMLIKGISPNVQDYDNRTALHLAASEGHAPIVELLLHYKANVNLVDRWQRTALTDASLYGHRDICKILEVNGGKDFLDDQDQQMSIPQEDLSEVNFDISELHTQDSSTIQQGIWGESVKVKWRGTWVVKTVIKRQISQPMDMTPSAKDNTLLRKLRHPNILQFLGSIEKQEEIILITEYLSKGNLEDILNKRGRLDLPTALGYALDIARGMNYLHEHKPFPIVHNHLDTRNLLVDESGHLKIGEYWVQMYEEINPKVMMGDTKKDILSFGYILCQMIEGRQFQENTSSELMHLESFESKPTFQASRCSKRIRELIEQCRSISKQHSSPMPWFGGFIRILEEECLCLRRLGCPVC